MVFNNNLLLGASGVTAGYEIEQSIRFNNGDDPYLLRTVGTPTSTKKFTFSTWIKPTTFYNDTSARSLFSSATPGDTSVSRDIFRWSNDVLYLAIYTGSWYELKTNQVFRDPASWYHIVLSMDTTQSTESNRTKLYVNGSQVSDFATETYVAQDTAVATLTSGKTQAIGAYAFNATSSPVCIDGYMAEIHFIDGQQLAPTDFGENNSNTGQWIPKKYGGSYGNQGFYIKGEDSSDLGNDSSGNGNDFTSSGLAANDQVTDSPTNNQSTLNPLWAGAGLSDGSLVATATGNSYQWAVSTFAVDDGGKHVCEFQKSSGTFGYIGLYQLGNHTATTGNNYGYFYNLGTGEIVKNGSLVTDLGTGAANSLMRLEYDSATDTLEFFDDGSSIHSATTGLSGHNSLHFGCAPYASGTIITATFSPLSGTPTTDFKELTAANLSNPTIADPSKYFQTTLYSGNSSTQEINQSGNSTFTPGWVWIKPRNGTGYSHQLFDQVRGATKRMQSDAASAEDTNATTLTSFDSDGFSLGSHVSVNETGKNMVAWQWKANGSGSSNTDGSINSTVSANITSGFSIVSYSGNETSGATVGHGLGADVKMIILKDRGVAESWVVFHEAMGPTKFVYLNDTMAAFTASNRWNDTSPTSSVFTLGDETQVNGSGRNYIAYCFAEVEGFSKFGSYEGNGSTDGPFVYTGFKPRWVMIKRYDSTESWPILDTARGSGNFGSDAGSSGDNPTAGNDLNAVLVASTSAAEEDNPSGSRRASYLSNGFKVRTTNTAMNASGGDYLYMAFAESPFKTATAR